MGERLGIGLLQRVTGLPDACVHVFVPVRLRCLQPRERLLPLLLGLGELPCRRLLRLVLGLLRRGDLIPEIRFGQLAPLGSGGLDAGVGLGTGLLQFLLRLVAEFPNCRGRLLLYPLLLSGDAMLRPGIGGLGHTTSLRLRPGTDFHGLVVRNRLIARRARFGRCADVRFGDRMWGLVRGRPCERSLVWG